MDPVKNIQFSIFEEAQRVAVSIASGTKELPKRYKNKYFEALHSLKEGKEKIAIKLLNDHVISYPTDKIAYQDLGRAYFKQQKFIDAVISLETSIRLGNESAQTFFELGMAHNRCHQLIEAKRIRNNRVVWSET